MSHWQLSHSTSLPTSRRKRNYFAFICRRYLASVQASILVAIESIRVKRIEVHTFHAVRRSTSLPAGDKLASILASLLTGRPDVPALHHAAVYVAFFRIYGIFIRSDLRASFQLLNIFKLVSTIFKQRFDRESEPARTTACVRPNKPLFAAIYRLQSNNFLAFVAAPNARRKALSEHFFANLTSQKNFVDAVKL